MLMMVEEVLRDKGLVGEDREAIDRLSRTQGGCEGKKWTQVPESSRGPTTRVHEVGKAQTSTPPTTTNIPSSPSFSEINYLFSSTITQTSNSTRTTLSINQRALPLP